MIAEEISQETAALTLEQRRAFMRLPLAERRRRLAEQAESMLEHYNQEEARQEREEWQGGDIIEFPRA